MQMQVFKRELTETHCIGAEWPEFCGVVEPGERFIIETVESIPNGPVEVKGIRKGDTVCILSIPVEDANTIVATACDIKNCALYGLGENYVPQDREKLPYDIAIVASLPKSIFADEGQPADGDSSLRCAPFRMT
jgi:hypothetical protein